MQLVQRKKQAAGTTHAEAQAASEACSVGIKAEYAKYVAKEKERLQKEARGSKGWWSRVRRLLQQSLKQCSIPALKKPAGEWCIDAKSKADHLADTFKSKFKLSQNVTNYYTDLEPLPYRGQTAIAEITEDRAEKVLLNLRSDSATGPDQLPTRIIKECAKELANPFCMFAKLILIEARWPELWTIHSIVPLYKKSSVYSAMNYRGVHLTAQLSKAMERFLGALFMPFLLKTIAFGPNQLPTHQSVGQGMLWRIWY